jgi:hypothetical protein
VSRVKKSDATEVAYQSTVLPSKIGNKIMINIFRATKLESHG